MFLRLVTSAVFVLVILASTITFAATGTSTGDTLPAISLTDIDGSNKTVQPSGRPIVLNFWRLGCGYCHDEMPDLVKFAAHYNQTVDFYSIDVVDNASAVSNYFNQYGFSFSNTLLIGENYTVWQQFRSRGVPLTVVTDKSGIIRHRILGALTYDELENYVADADHY